ncbi:MAG: hypothetical protein GX458_06065 [Phyllobacteriaceae bacterium]|nr:hypothetical protein [Phyllobacteriaceae bacterium]
MVLAAPAAAVAGGHWVSDGITYDPTQAELAAVGKMPGRIYEKRISGGFQATETAIGTVEVFFTADDPDHKVFLGTCSVSFRIDGAPMTGGAPGYATSGIVQVGGNDASKAAGATCSGAVAVDNADDAAGTGPVAIGATGNAKGTLVLPKGVPGATATIHVKAYLSIGVGAFGGRTDAHLRWVGD